MSSSGALACPFPIPSKPLKFLNCSSIRRFDVLKKKTGEPAPTFNIQRKNQHSKWSPINTKTTSKPISQKYILKKTDLPDDPYFGNTGCHVFKEEMQN